MSPFTYKEYNFPSILIKKKYLKEINIGKVVCSFKLSIKFAYLENCWKADCSKLCSFSFKMKSRFKFWKETNRKIAVIGRNDSILLLLPIIKSFVFSLQALLSHSSLTFKWRNNKWKSHLNILIKAEFYRVHM